MSYVFKHYTKGNTQGSGSYVFRKYSESVEPQVEAFITFSSPNSFTLSTVNNNKRWDGTLEYSTDKETWATWDGTTAISSGVVGTSNELYLRGTGNTKIIGYTGNNTKLGNSYRWVLTGSNIFCIGNIETLLDYATVVNGQHPPMVNGCYGFMFYNCASLISAPTLPATTLSSTCYNRMFNGCSSLTTVTALPATTLVDYCYNHMFTGCTNLEQLPSLPATTLKANCYNAMFNGCSKIKISTTQDSEYVNAYRIPTANTGTEASSSMTGMFTNTGGTFTETPTINTTYYTSNAIVNSDGTVTPAVN